MTRFSLNVSFTDSQVNDLARPLVDIITKFYEDPKNEEDFQKWLRKNMTTNRKIGNSFETEFCELLYAHGFWVHNLAQNAAGQPADVIAARNGKTYLIDCKVCSNRGFALSRMEENQDLSMELWKDTGNGDGWFAILIKEHIFMVSHSIINFQRSLKSRMSKLDFETYGVPLERWLKEK